MGRTKEITKGAGKVVLALVGGALMPIWIWVAFGAAISQKLHERSTQRKPAPTIGEILAAAGLSIQGEPILGKTMASKVFARRSVSEIHELLAKAGLSIRKEHILKHYMERTIEITLGAGKVVLALVGGALMPLWIWVAFGVAMNQKLRERSAQRKPVPAKEKLAANYSVVEDKKS